VTGDPFAAVAGGLVVSVQAAPGTPLAAPEHLAALAAAAELGGAVGIRAEGGERIAAVRRAVGLPVIGLRKRRVEGSDVYITPEAADARAVAAAGADAVAVDATARRRPGGVDAPRFVAELVGALDVPVVADVDTCPAGVAARAAGAAAVATTLAGYTAATSPGPRADGGGEAVASAPDVDLVAQLAAELDCPVLAEGRYATPEQVAAAFEAGAHAVVIGTAITDAIALTRAFVAATPAYGVGRGDGGR
jgi:N-acylglucosamine-6-phosphate 2-epimerase